MKNKDQLFEEMQRSLEEIIKNASVKSPDELYAIMVQSAQCALIGVASVQGQEVAVNTAQAIMKWLIERPADSFPKVEYIRRSALVDTPKTIQ